MREFVVETGAYHFCGEPPPDPYAEDAVYVGGRSAACLDVRWEGCGLLSVPRERSGLAYAAGFAGVLYLFRCSFAPLAAMHWEPASALATALVFIWNLLAPLALVLAFTAAVSLDRSPEKSGALPALFGFCVGWFGTVAWLFMLDRFWLNILTAF